MKGVILALFELIIFFIIAYITKTKITNLNNLSNITFYWLMFTILTGIWESFFIMNYKDTRNYSLVLLKNKTHVWNNNYNISYILPWNFSKIFYSEYGAYADREYMALGDDWSRTIEGTHAIYCGIFSLYALILKIENYHNNYLIASSVAMGTQVMNSILYLINYFIEINNKSSVNYDSVNFPCGKYLIKRPFMYINILWFVMPSYIIIESLLKNYENRKINYDY